MILQNHKFVFFFEICALAWVLLDVGNHKCVLQNHKLNSFHTIESILCMNESVSTFWMNFLNITGCVSERLKVSSKTFEKSEPADFDDTVTMQACYAIAEMFGFLWPAHGGVRRERAIVRGRERSA